MTPGVLGRCTYRIQTPTNKTIAVLDPIVPRHNVFATLENADFYSTKPYTALNESQQEIRLTKVLPDDKHGFINCELLRNNPLAEVRGAHNALSYCAGDLRKTDVVLINGVKCNVFANLKHALVEARRFWRENSKEREVLLWVDQLCIDQSNIAERSHQVGLMRDIYQSAEQVIICLSTEKCSGRGMNWLLKLYEHVPPLKDDMELKEDGSFVKDADRNSNTFPEEDCADGSVPVSEPSLSRYHWSRLMKYLWDNMLDEDFTNGWLAFYDIFECQWWKRAWVFQEFFISSQSSFLYGRKYISWTHLSPILASFCAVHDSMLTNRDKFLELNEQFDLDGPEDRQLCRVIQRSTRDGCSAAVASVKFMVTSKLNEFGTMDLKCLLENSRYCQASDDRDRVFAFLGLGDPGHRINPDYRVENSVVEVLIDTTKSIILFEDSLEVLCHAVASLRDTSKSLPSWVVDWTCPELGKKRGHHYGKMAVMNGLKKMKTNCSFRDVYDTEGVKTSVILEVWGIYVGTLLLQDPSKLDSLEQYALFPSFTVTGGHLVCTSSLAQCRDQLWILDGASVPLILRPQEKDYLVISSALTIPNNTNQGSEGILQLMIDLVEEGQKHRKQISIV